MLIPACVALYYNEMRTFKVFILVALSVAAIQLPIFMFTRQKEMDVNSRDGIAVAALGWIVISFYGCLPFYISGEIPNFTNASLKRLEMNSGSHSSSLDGCRPAGYDAGGMLRDGFRSIKSFIL